jgi:hypothetical protein
MNDLIPEKAKIENKLWGAVYVYIYNIANAAQFERIYAGLAILFST